jgi:histidinol phosphatase-like enzyme
MIKEIERRHNVDIKTSILIGDSEADCEMASNCGMLYLKVAQDQSKSPDISAQIYEAISRIKS